MSLGEGAQPATTAGVQSSTSVRSRRERIGISISAPHAPALLDMIVEAEAGGVEQVWMTQNPVSSDTLTAYAAALGRTKRIRLGTSIVPIYPRHPLALAQQAATVDMLGPGRLRLGIGPSHRPDVERTYGLAMQAPLEYMQEYVAVLRAALWEGQVDHQGRFLTAQAKLNSTPRVPLLISALGERAFHLAGQIADGAISWNCPIPYLLDVALPALRAGAQAADRVVPPLVAHLWVALSMDADTVRAVAKKRIGGYAQLPFYANMFAAAGYHVGADGTISDALIENLVVMGDTRAVAERLRALLASGLDELLLSGLTIGDAAVERAQLFNIVGQLS
jgi:F420-dependent oxidoreductase-like protein